MANILKIAQSNAGIAISFLILMPAWQICFAQAADETTKPAASANELIKVPLTGYRAAAKSEESEKGKKLFEELNCMACHTIHAIGGDLAPALDGVGGRRNDKFLMAHLSSAPKAQDDYKQIRGMDFANSLAHTKYSPETAKLLVSYLNTLPEPAGGFVVMPHKPRLPAINIDQINKDFHSSPKTESSIEGGKFYDKFGCVACHAIGEVGGWFGPRLDGVGARHNRAYISAHVTDAQAHTRGLSEDHEPSSQMPRFSISSEEVKKITDYLMTLPAL